MKKIAVFVLLLGACVLNAEEMRFVTTLSSPLGTFAQLETADPSALSSVPLVNFCNSRASAGTVTLQGADTYIQTLALKNATVLGGNTPEYRISGALSVNNNSEVTGGRLLANAATVSGASSAKSKVEGVLYASALKVKGAKTAGLTIPGQVQTSGSGNNDELEWSNIYTKDYKSDGSATGSDSYTSYLLKSKSATPVEPEGYKHEPYVKTVRAAKVCGRLSYTEYCRGRDKVGDKEKDALYYYADNITQKENWQQQRCNMCQWGKPQTGFSGSGKHTDTSYTNLYNGITDCPSGYTDAQLCQNNCNPAVKNCSFVCLKTAANITGCGNELIQQRCLCSCGTRPGEAACKPTFDLSWDCKPDGSTDWMLTSQTVYIYEPKLGGTGQILGCRAVL